MSASSTTTTTAATPAAAAAAVPKAQFDWRPLALLVGLMGLALPAIGTPSTWVTLLSLIHI